MHKRMLPYVISAAALAIAPAALAAGDDPGYYHPRQPQSLGGTENWDRSDISQSSSRDNPDPSVTPGVPQGTYNESTIGSDYSSQSGDPYHPYGVGRPPESERYSTGSAGYRDYDTYHYGTPRGDFQYRLRPDLNGGSPGNYSTMDPRAGASG